jgi:hypothetical protein
MRTFIPIKEDASIYQRYPLTNTGLDEVLEVGKVVKSTDGDAMYASGSARILLNIDMPSENQYPTNSLYYLNLKIANAKNVNRYQTLEVYPVSRSWVEGSGYFYQDTQNSEDGVTWTTYNATSNWNSPGGNFVTSTSSLYEMSSVPITDVKINVTNIISSVVRGINTTPWNGLIIKFPTADEANSKNKGNIKFFSSNTHTIFAPKLEVLYPSQVFSTGSLKPIPNGNVTVIPKNLKESYTIGEIDKVYLIVRDPFPDKRFDAVQRYRSMYYLPSSSYFRITDQVSGVVVYEFDQYSSINCDSSGSYITLDTTSLDIDRYYTIDLKINKNGLVFFPEFNYSFKVDNDGY